MNKILYLFILELLACNGASNKKQHADEITGVYTGQSEGEFSKVSDTLVVSEYSLEAYTYLVERNTGFNRIIDGHAQAREYKSEKMLMVYDVSIHQLQDRKTGKLFTFDPKGQLLFGVSTYKKIK